MMMNPNLNLFSYLTRRKSSIDPKQCFDAVNIAILLAVVSIDPQEKWALGLVAAAAAAAAVHVLLFRVARAIVPCVLSDPFHRRDDRSEIRSDSRDKYIVDRTILVYNPYDRNVRRAMSPRCILDCRRQNKSSIHRRRQMNNNNDQQKWWW